MLLYACEARDLIDPCSLFALQNCRLIVLMGVFDGGSLETKTMSRVGCLDYTATQWEHTKPGVLERHASYKFNRYMSIFGGEVVSTQLKFPSEDGDGWTIYDVMTLHNVPFGDYFRVRFLRAKLIINSSCPLFRQWTRVVRQCLCVVCAMSTGPFEVQYTERCVGPAEQPVRDIRRHRVAQEQQVSEEDREEHMREAGSQGRGGS